MNQENNANPGVFINGKAQVIEMLRFMTPEEKQRILRDIRKKNPQLASELTESSLSFNDIERINEDDIYMSFGYVKAEIWGLALKGTSREFQRKILSIAERGYAERAYEVMVTPVRNEEAQSKRAQQKVIGVFANLFRRQQINV